MVWPSEISFEYAPLFRIADTTCASFLPLVLNFLIGNGDAHGKNFSFLYDGKSAKLAPLYDLVCTQAYPTLSPEMAMKVGDERKPGRLLPRNWRKFFEEAGFGQSRAVMRFRDFVHRVQKETQSMLEMEVEGAREVAPVVLANCQRLISQGWETNS